MQLEDDLRELGYERVEYNGGAFYGYRKTFGKVRNHADWKACSVEVRFGERNDQDFLVYLRFSNFLVPLPGLRIMPDIEALRRLLSAGCNG